MIARRTFVVVSQPILPPISSLRGLLEVTRLVRTTGDLPELLRAIARVIAESLGYATVAINLHRPEWDDFECTTVYGSPEAEAVLVGLVRRIEDWEPLLADRFARRGAYFVRAGEFDWSQEGGDFYLPEQEAGVGEDAWHPLDALFVPMRHHDGHLLGILSVDEPASRRRASDEELDVLVALADHAALAVQSAQEEAENARHRLALEQLLRVSSGLTGHPNADAIMQRVCVGVRDALGFENVMVVSSDIEGRITPRAAIGWEHSMVVARPMYLADLAPLLDSAFEVEGCFLVPNDEAEKRISRETFVYASRRNGRGPRAWNRHWLLVPLHGADDDVIGLLAVDEPADRLLPSPEKLQALRIFANQAAAAIVAAENVQELRFLADHDPLTRLLNRRAFVERLDSEVARALRFGRVFGLVLCDLDGFKGVNDTRGHPAGDDALEAFGRIVRKALRKHDAAFRIGGDEFAILLAEASEDDAREVIGRIRRKLDRGVDARLIGMQASFGVAECPADADDAQTLFRRADEALYEAKRSGSGIVFV
jgi:diguanylate cyclase (GGDEF)-like protein